MGIRSNNTVDNIVEDARCEEGHGSRPSSRASSRPSSRASAASSESSGIGAARSLASSISRASSKKLGILQDRNETPTSAGGDTISVFSHRSGKSGADRSGYSGSIRSSNTDHTGSTGHSSKTDRSHNTQLTNEDAAKAYDQILSYCDKDGAYAPTPPREKSTGTASGPQRAPSFVSAYSAALTVQGTVANSPEEVDDDDDDAVIQEYPSLIVEQGVKKLEGIAEEREKEEADDLAFQKQQEEGEDDKSEAVGDKKNSVEDGNVIAVRLPTDDNDDVESSKRHGGEPTESVTYMGPIPGHKSRGKKVSFAKLKSKRLFGSKKVDKSPPPSPIKEVVSIASKEAFDDETGEMPRVGSNAGESINTNGTENVTLDSTDPDVVEVTINEVKEEVDIGDHVPLNMSDKDAEDIEVFDSLVSGDTFETIQKQSTDNNTSFLQQFFTVFQCEGDTSIEKPELFGVTSGELVLLYEDEVDEQLDIEVINDKNNVARIGFYAPSQQKKERPKAEEKEALDTKEPVEEKAAQADDIDVTKESALADEIDEATKLPSDDTQEENTDESVVEPMKVESKVILKTKVVPGVEVVSDGQSDVVVDSVAAKIEEIAEKLEHRRKEQGALKAKKTSVRMIRKIIRKIKSKKTKKSKGILDKVEVNYTIEDAPKGSKRKWKSKARKPKTAEAEEKEGGLLCGELACGGGEDDLDEPFNDVFM